MLFLYQSHRHRNLVKHPSTYTSSQYLHFAIETNPFQHNHRAMANNQFPPLKDDATYGVKGPVNGCKDCNDRPQQKTESTPYTTYTTGNEDNLGTAMYTTKDINADEGKQATMKSRPRQIKLPRWRSGRFVALGHQPQEKLRNPSTPSSS